MKLVEPRYLRKVGEDKGPPKFNGKVKVVVQGYDQYGKTLSRKYGTPARGFSVEGTTVDEVYLVLTKAIKEEK